MLISCHPEYPYGHKLREGSAVCARINNLKKQILRRYAPQNDISANFNKLLKGGINPYEQRT